MSRNVRGTAGFGHEESKGRRSPPKKFQLIILSPANYSVFVGIRRR